MVEIRTYEGDAEELSTFTQRVWRAQYAGKVPVTIWSPALLRWQLLNDRPGARDFLVAAYDGTRLVGTMPCQRLLYCLRGEVMEGTMLSWQSVDPDYGGQTVSRKMHRELWRRHLKHGVRLSLGFLLKGTLGVRYWEKDKRSAPVREFGFWVRMLDHRAVAKWEPSPWLGLGARAVGLIQSRPSGSKKTCPTRPYKPQDLEACLALAQGLQNQAEFGYAWDADQLAHQLSFDTVPRTLVAGIDGEVKAFINYFHTALCAKGDLPTATIDLIAFGSLSRSSRRAFLRAALNRMREEGAAMAQTLRLPNYAWSTMTGAGFVPLPELVKLRATPVDRSLAVGGIKRVLVCCR